MTRGDLERSNLKGAELQKRTQIKRYQMPGKDVYKDVYNVHIAAIHLALIICDS